jgi:hypothetical protein
VPLVQEFKRRERSWSVKMGLEIPTREAGFVGQALTDDASLVIRLVENCALGSAGHALHNAESAARQIGTCVFAGAERDRFARREIARGPGSGDPHA